MMHLLRKGKSKRKPNSKLLKLLKNGNKWLKWQRKWLKKLKSKPRMT